MIRALPLVVVGWVSSCASPMELRGRLDNASHLVEAATRAYGTVCAPVELANAQAHLDFSKLELALGNLARADEHLALATQFGQEALDVSMPCGGVDRDRDFVADIVDQCPDEPEDPNGLRDGDGCPDAAPADVPAPPELATPTPTFEPDWMFEPDQPPPPPPPSPEELENVRIEPASPDDLEILEAAPPAPDPPAPDPPAPDPPAPDPPTPDPQ